jgi:RHS repeat-associated protein
VYRTLLKFDFSLIPATADVESGDLWLWPASGTSPTPPTIRAYNVTTNWSPWTQASWSNATSTTAWTNPGGDIDTTTAAYTAVGYTNTNDSGFINATQLTEDWFSGATPNYGLLLKEPTEDVAGVTTATPIMSVTWQSRIGQQSTQAMQTRHLTDQLTVSVSSANGNVVVQGTALNVAGVGQNLDLGYSIDSDGTFRTNFDWPGTNIQMDGAEDGSFTFQRPDGYDYYFLHGPNGWVSPPGADATVTQSGDLSNGTYKIRFNDTGLTYTYSTGYLRNIADSNGNTITYHYDNSGNPQQVSSITDTQGRTFTLTYASGPLVLSPSSITDQAGNRVVSLTYDGSYPTSRIASVTDADGHTTTFGYDSHHYLTTVTDDDGHVTTMTPSGVYSQLLNSARISSITYGSGTSAASTYTYAYPSATSTTVTDPNGGVTTYTLDSAQRVTSTVDPLGHTVSSSWSPNNDPASQTDGLSAVTSYTYDTLNNVTKVTSPQGTGTQRSTTFGYPTPTGALSDYQATSSEDAEGNTTTYSYNSSNELATTTTLADAGGTPTDHYQGDTGVTCTNAKPGEVCSSVDGNGNTTSYSYDTSGNVVAITPPTPLGATSMTYDADGRMVTNTDGNGNTLHYTYDGENRITQVSTSASSCATNTCVKYTYNAEGWLTKRVDPSGTTNYTYDAQGRALTMDTPTGDTSYTWDGNGNLASYTDGGGTTSYRYDAANNVDALAEPGGSCPTTVAFPNSTQCTTFGYDADNNRTATNYPNGQTIATAYDAGGRETSVTAANHAGTTLVSRAYSYALGTADTDLRQSVTDQTGAATTYTYDPMNRALSATTGTAAQSWTYDADSNRLTATSGSTTTNAKYNAADQLCYTTTVAATAACGSAPSGATAYSYDSDGNETAGGSITGSTFTPFEQTASITTGSTTAQFSYSDISSDQRTQSGSTDYVNGTLGVTRQGSGSSAIEYIRDPEGNLIAMETSSGSYYYTTDALGSTILLTDSSGAAAATYTYDTWGNTTSTVSGVAATNPFRYAAGATDADGLIKFGTRYYDPTTGRFTQQDPSNQESNLYAYVGCNPINATDPSGLSATCGELIGLSAIFVGGLVGEFAFDVFAVAAAAPTAGLSLAAGTALAIGTAGDIGAGTYTVLRAIQKCS